MLDMSDDTSVENDCETEDMYRASAVSKARPKFWKNTPASDVHSLQNLLQKVDPSYQQVDNARTLTSEHRNTIITITLLLHNV